MRAREYLFENREAAIEKLRALIDHPTTEENTRSVARNKLTLLLAQAPAVPTEPRSRITVETNITEEHLDQQFLTGVSMGQIYEGLCSLNPSPNKIHFLRQGQIQMMVPPPFMGKTRRQYYDEIQSVCAGARNISDRMIEGSGYFFVISYV